MKKIVYLFLLFFTISCSNKSEIYSYVGKELSTSKLINKIYSNHFKSEDKNILEVKFVYDKKTKMNKILSVNEKEPDVFLIESKSKRNKLDCYNTKDKSEWVKVCSNTNDCSKYFCDCVIGSKQSTNFLIYSPRSKTIFLKVKY
jgi:hypothetical protein